MNLRLSSLNAGLIGCVLLLGWVVFFDGDGFLHSKVSGERDRAATKGNEGTGVEKKSLRQHMSYKPVKKRIDVKARLAALYEKYPDLRPDYPESDKDFTELFGRLLSNDVRDELGVYTEDLAVFFIQNDDLDDKTLRAYLNSHKVLLDELISTADPNHNYKEVMIGCGWREIQSFATHCYIVNLRLGNVQRAAELRKGLAAMRKSSSLSGRIGLSHAISGEMQMANYIFQLAGEYPNEAEKVLSGSATREDLFSALKGEYTRVLEMAYEMAELGDDGKFYLDGGEGVGVVSIDRYEEIGAREVLWNLEYYRSLGRGRGAFLAGHLSDAELKREFESLGRLQKFVAQESYSEVEQVVADTFSIGDGYYLSAVLDYELKTKSLLCVVRIAKLNSGGQVYDGGLPINPKTGEPVIWDKERNVLITGLEGEDAEIKIPVLKSE